ncbi:MAK10-like protein [Tanacetum coccineum]|uniref:MAK10-like protein n=1 Tax=Tanacetum coccineum TaxID=301880 RepID=A0ABQ5EE46_9ASTR
MYYIGWSSESVEQDVMHSYDTTIGDSGIVMCCSLALELAWIFYRSDQWAWACVSEVGVSLCNEPRFHQLAAKAIGIGFNVRFKTQMNQSNCFWPIHTSYGDGVAIRLVSFGFNTIITSLNALNEGFSSKNYVRKFLKLYIQNEEQRKKRKDQAHCFKAKKESSDDETLTCGSDNKEYSTAIRDFKKFFRRKGRFVRQPREEKKSFRKMDDKKAKIDRKCFRCGDPNHLIGDIQSLYKTRNKKLLSGVLGVIVKMRTRTKLTKKLVSWLNRQMSANSLNEMLSAQRSSSSKGGLGFDKNEASTSETKKVHFVKSTTVLAGYENDPRDFAKPVKAISLPHDVLNASDRRLIELENQVQCLMEAHLAPKPSVQVNKIASSFEICSAPYDNQYCMENPKQAFVEYASSCTDEAGDARLSRFEADFKQQQSKMTNKIDTFLKAINDRMMGALPSDTVKNPKLNVNPTSSVLSARSYPTEDPQSSSLKTLMVNKIGTPKPKEPEKALEDEFKDLHLKLPVLKVLARAPMYNAILDKYVESLELDGTKSYPVGIVRNVEVHIGKLKLLEDFYVIEMEKDPTCPLLVGRGFLVTASAVIDCKKAKIVVREGITMSIF